MIVGFGLSWIPYIAGVGGLLSLIGVLLVYLGRDAFGPRHRRFVVVGGFLLLLSILIAIVAALSFTASIFNAASTPGATPMDLASAIQSAFNGLVESIVVAGLLSGLATVLIPYALADRKTQVLLWASFALGIAISVVVIAVLLPAISSAIQQLSSVSPGTAPNLGPIYAVRDESNLLTLLKIFPSALLIIAYWRLRERAKDLRWNDMTSDWVVDPLGST